MKATVCMASPSRPSDVVLPLVRRRKKQESKATEFVASLGYMHARMGPGERVGQAGLIAGGGTEGGSAQRGGALESVRLVTNSFFL